MQDSELTPSRHAIECGDYGQALRALEPLAAANPASSMAGTRVRLLMGTALMGLGRDAEALAQVRLVARCGDRRLRPRARELVTILEAPALKRLASGSMTLLDLGRVGALGDGGGRSRQPLAAAKQALPPPPVGATRPPFGFVVVVGVLLLVLTLLLGGCVDVELELEFRGPGRARIQQTLQAPVSHPTPWQRAVLEGWLHQDGGASRPKWHSLADQGSHAGSTALHLRSDVLPLPDAAALVSGSLGEAQAHLGLSLPPPGVVILERNWLLGVVQQGRISFDLRLLDDMPGVNARVRLEPLSIESVRVESGSAPRQEGRSLLWPLKTGEINVLVWHCWRWSPMGLGSLTIGVLLSLSLILRRLQLASGGGYPELPPPRASLTGATDRD